MYITFLGHAGFLVETERAIILMDPWLSSTGAFDASWFQLPRNHHVAAYVDEKFENSEKEKYIYISHEHKDHFDPKFLRSISMDDCTFVIPKFRRPELRTVLGTYPHKSLVACEDGVRVPIPGGYVQIYLEDKEMERDSSILIEAEGQIFFNINDCKLHDRLRAISEEHHKIDVFTAQFSGAIWHPTCYDYPKKVYEAISRRKIIHKFESVARAIETVQPRVFWPSAGPACFLDPELMHLNFERENIFPRAPKLFKYLNKRLKNPTFNMWEPMPGDIIDVSSSQPVFLTGERLTDDNFQEYIRKYAQLNEGLFEARKRQYERVRQQQILERLKEQLEYKLSLLTLRHRVRIPLYFRLSDMDGPIIRVDFANTSVSYAVNISEQHYYSIASPSWEVERVLDGKLNWEDFTLTFRMRLNREPDVYHTVIHGFLTMEPEDMNWFCEKLLRTEANQERMIVESQGCRYSVNRYCPHQGADLSEGWMENDGFLTCARHRWQFDLKNDGKCTTNDTSIHAFLFEDI
jgi:UDP-MurNAc hydroxylase